ncbi:MAG: hypothetical protein ABS96_12995 [Lysobacteraceae bacterium SCN 69-123]|jgi:hypothetical protein|uniref:hypothetical protein n=1 Tax=Stenotrophomonas acidaminiphila TaxID=128780 RepID=UPI00086A61FD|nr:hypothetical protein [Stenotrophomonas acidaminiphila]MBN8802311.1 hypothetical protein [Stenotrophomonas acidaminiphila]MDF9443460.1 hypothetical protein [Stenotrophomonas acidaminiphila]ODU45583.1 MAG: hypothetical protein ABS96_12995 [Xanthomonadaceae bacterium SCN 69-123]OJY78498.1 MAG: hypothetical protein BGP18_05640 [Stenotrophomonas sp. 69-14]
MQPNVPIPTDSIYKFMTLFGFMLLVTTVVSTVYVHKSTNDELLAIAEAKYRLTVYLAARKADSKQITKALQEEDMAMQAIHDRRAEIAASDRGFYLKVLALPGGMGLALFGFGFYRWIKEQPLHDELLRLQVTKARLDVHGTTAPTDFIPAPTDVERRKAAKE